MVEIKENKIELAKKIDEMSMFFAENNLKNNYVSTIFDYSREYFNNCKRWINNQEGFDRFFNNQSLPLKSTQLINYIFQQLAVIFNAEDRIYSFTNEKNNEVIENELDFDLEFYQNKVFNLYKIAPNTKIVITAEGVDFVYSNEFLSYELDNYGNFVFFEFQRGELNYQYSLIELKLTNKKTGVINTVPNISGICPVFHISNELFHTKDFFVRKNVFTEYLADIEEFEFLNTLKKIISPKAFYLFTVKFREPNCRYEDSTYVCESGYMSRKSDGLLTNLKCPSCNSDLGIGNEIRLPVTASSAEELQIVGEPLKFISPATDILKYSDDFLRNKKEDIINNILGVENKISTNVAQTANAYDYATRSKEQVILQLADNFRKIISIFENGKLKLTLPDVKFNLNLGTAFLMRSFEDLLEEYKIAKELDFGSIIDYESPLISKKYEHDIPKKLRALVLAKFHPNISKENLAMLPDCLPKQKQILFDDYIAWVENYKNINYADIDLAYKQLNQFFNEYLKFIEYEKSRDFSNEKGVAIEREVE